MPVDYARQVVFINNVEATLAESFEMKTESGEQPILILNEGLAGFTPGAGQTTISGTLYVPVGGFQIDVQSFCANGEYVPIQYGVGPVAYVGTGKFTEVTISGGVNEPVKVQFTWLGEKKAME
jgi:hypothetical protein